MAARRIQSSEQVTTVHGLDTQQEAEEVAALEQRAWVLVELQFVAGDDRDISQKHSVRCCVDWIYGMSCHALRISLIDAFEVNCYVICVMKETVASFVALIGRMYVAVYVSNVIH